MSVLKTLGYVGKKQSKIFKADPEPPRKIIHLLDDLELCYETKWVEDRLGGYADYRLNRKKARKVIEKWLKNSTPQSRV